MSHFILLYGARQLLTLRGQSSARRGSALLDIGLIENGSVLVENGAIFAVGPTRRIENLKQARDAVMIDVSGSIIMPGLVDPDFHVTSATPSAAGLSRQIKPTRIFEDGLALMRSCLQHGTLGAVLKTCSESDNYQADAALLRQWTKIGDSNVDLVRDWHIRHPPQNVHDLEAFGSMLRALARRKLIDAISYAPASGYERVAKGWMAPIFECNLPIHLQWNGSSAADLFLGLNQAQPASICCPAALSSGEVSIIAESPAVAVFAPGTELQATGCGLRDVAAAGGAVALSSGYHPITAPGFSMQMAISLAIVRGQLTPEQAISAATVNAAYAAGLGGITGTLERGKRADVLVMNVPDYRDIARQFGINHVGTVLRAGTVAFHRSRWKKIVADESTASRVRSQHL